MAVSHDLKALKPDLPIVTILNMAVGFFGFQIGFALQNANASRIAQSLGADYGAAHSTYYRVLIRPDLGSIWPPPTLLYDRGFTGRFRTDFHAQFALPLDCGKLSLDSRLCPQYFDGAFPGFCGP